MAAARLAADPTVGSLLVRLPNWVGDVCMALPALTALDARGVAPVLVGRGWAADLLAAHGWPVHRLAPGLRAAARQARALGPRHGLLFTNSLSSALAFRLGGVRAVGHRNEGRSPLLGRAVPKVDGVHEVECGWRLAASAADWLSIADWPAAPPPSLGLRLADAHRAMARDALRVAGVGDDYVVLAPLAVGTIDGASKAWSGFGDLAAALRARGVVVVGCPGPREEAAMRAALPDATLLQGLGLGAYAAVCAGARLTVANDSGPMHLAAALDAPVIGIFGPSRPQRTRPWGPRATWLGGDGRWPAYTQVLAAVEAALDAAGSAR